MKQDETTKRIGVSTGELVGACLIVISACLMFWKTTDVRLSALELRMNESDKTNTIINSKLDKLQDGINDVKVSLQNKADRK